MITLAIAVGLSFWLGYVISWRRSLKQARYYSKMYIAAFDELLGLKSKFLERQQKLWTWIEILERAEAGDENALLIRRCITVIGTTSIFRNLPLQDIYRTILEKEKPESCSCVKGEA